MSNELVVFTLIIFTGLTFLVISIPNNIHKYNDQSKLTPKGFDWSKTKLLKGKNNEY